MFKSKEFKVVYAGNVEEFEEQILYNADQEVRKGVPGIWCKIADEYARQLTIIKINPYPEESDEDLLEDGETPPSIKYLNKNTVYNNFYRWGIQGGRTGNHRIIFAIHNFSKVILLYHFDKQYNGLIKRDDLIPAECNYEEYCINDPNLY